ncbi:MAG: prepilin-type N-terminal cleavage/methylation domain-containing protein [Acidobacteriota bacterium]
MELKRAQQGFSVVEVLIASLIFLIIAVGILPLFAASTRNTTDGREATEVSNFGRSAVEDLMQATFNDARLTLPSSGTVLTTNQYYSKASQTWVTGTASSADPALWQRRIKVRQYNVNDYMADGLLNNPLPGSADLGQVHIKEIEVEVWHARADTSLAFGSPNHFTVRMLKTK